MACLSCGRGLHQECKKCRKGKCHPVAQANSGEKILRGVGRPLKEPHEQLDPASTGRKRAAHLYPIFIEEPCEWQGKKNCGGGKYPIIGCVEGKQKDRHHGPIKDTRHNEPGNVHRICKACHNRWHALNDPIYSAEENRNIPHKPEPATELELQAANEWWKMPSSKRLIKEAKAGED